MENQDGYHLSKHELLPGMPGDAADLDTMQTAALAVKVKQRPYRSSSGPFSQHPAVSFVVNGRRGIPLQAAFQKDFIGLERKDSPVFETVTWSRPSIRIGLEGYRDYTRQLTINDAAAGRPTTLAKLAHMIAAEMVRVFEDQYDRKVDPPVPYTATMETLLLIEVRHVSGSSIQPEFMLILPDLWQSEKL